MSETRTSTSFITDEDREFVFGLSLLDPLDYDVKRLEAAEQLGVRVSVLDKAVKIQQRKNGQSRAGETEGQGTALVFEEPEPWPIPVDGPKFLGELAVILARHVVLPPGAATVIPLWIAHTYTLNAATTSPILALTSPVKRCGKTSLLAVLQSLVLKPLASSNVTAAALFRSAEKWTPTLLIDEADSFLRSSDDLRGICNSGHTKTSAFVLRTVGDDHEPRRFKTWCPKAIALIGQLPDTLTDRSIEIPMRRKTTGERVERLNPNSLCDLGDIRKKIARWAQDTAPLLETADPEIPEGLHDREADNYRPLLAIADTAGGVWPERARRAALVLSGVRSDDGESARTLLLQDIHAILESRDGSRIASTNLVDGLVKIEERPWPEWGRQKKPLSPRALATLLSPFGIRPKQIRLGDRVVRGYERSDFDDAWSRYCPQVLHPLQASDSAEELEFTKCYTARDVADGKNDESPENKRLVTDVAVGEDQEPTWRIK
jgi:putative DNA primase/helicase